VGLILSEGTVVERPGSANHPDIPHFYGEALAAWKDVIDAVHREHGQMGPQIWHVGKVPPQDPSLKLAAPPEGPDSMTTQDIDRTIQAFGEAGGQAKKLGFDCVELHGAHGYLIDQFFWDKTNQRSDAFGGKNIGERSRFAIEVIRSVRRAIGPDMALIIRLSQWKQQDYQAKLDSLVKTPKWAKNGSPSARNHWGENLENGFLRVNQACADSPRAGAVVGSSGGSGSRHLSLLATSVLGARIRRLGSELRRMGQKDHQPPDHHRGLGGPKRRRHRSFQGRELFTAGP
jgi:2,4-dienoyl-CoA reductase-like NADH-dependent reductase (Old Yellow Enzyme family)